MDKQKAVIELKGEFDGEELEEIIRNLAMARAGTAPAVPMTPPTGLTEDDSILLQDEAKFSFRRLANGGLRIWLRNEGIGWAAFTLSTADVAGIKAFLSKDDPGPHLSH